MGGHTQVPSKPQQETMIFKDEITEQKLKMKAFLNFLLFLIVFSVGEARVNVF